MMKRNIYRLFINTILFSALLYTYGSAAAEERETLKGDAFTDTSRHVQMPEKWIKRPIKYEKWAEGADLSVTLDQHLYPALLPIIKGYAKEHNLDIAVKEGTCGITAGMLARKTVDIGGFCCPPGAEDRLPGLTFHTLGIGAIAILINSDNPIDDITLDQTRKIFQGKIFHWSEIEDLKGQKGIDLKIKVIGRLHCKARPGHWRLLLDHEDMFSPRMKEIGTIQDMIYHVAVFKGAIGYEIPWNIHRYKLKRKIKVLKIGGYDSYEPDHLISLRYPLYRTYNITTWEGEGITNSHALKLVDHILKEMGHLNKKFNIIPASKLRERGWKFKDNELVGQPQ